MRTGPRKYFVTREVIHNPAGPGKGVVRLLVEETGPHHVTVLSYKKRERMFFKKKNGASVNHITAISTAAVTGGSMDVFDPDAAMYGASIDAVSLPRLFSVPGYEEACAIGSKLVSGIDTGIIAH
ncbi:MAG TPA: hypothetical protein ENN55_02735 [Firmicutes bacterium]|nr:hypothetical protein [Bacillota bacterium]